MSVESEPEMREGEILRSEGAQTGIFSVILCRHSINRLFEE